MKRGGFTLVEIMIVVAIIGLLAAIAIPNFIRARATTLANKCVNNLRLIQAGKDQYAIENAVPDTTTPGEDEVRVYLKNEEMPDEPTGGGYDINAINTNATCDTGLDGHSL